MYLFDFTVFTAVTCQSHFVVTKYNQGRLDATAEAAFPRLHVQRTFLRLLSTTVNPHFIFYPFYPFYPFFFSSTRSSQIEPLPCTSGQVLVRFSFGWASTFWGV